jgi:hypothetical protein
LIEDPAQELTGFQRLNRIELVSSYVVEETFSSVVSARGEVEFQTRDYNICECDLDKFD